LELIRSFVQPNIEIHKGMMRTRVNLGNNKSTDDSTKSTSKKGGVDAEQRSKAEKQDKFAIRLQGIIHSLFWIGAAVVSNTYLDTLRVIREDSRVWWFPFGVLAVLCIANTFGIAIYLTYVLPKTDPEAAKDYVNKRPKLSISAGASAMIGYIFMIVQFWPVWGFWSLLNITVSSFAVLMSGNLFPPYS
jgi:hypothetical protein